MALSEGINMAKAKWITGLFAAMTLATGAVQAQTAP